MLALALMLSLAAEKTPCTDADAAATPGSWVRSEDDVAMADPTFPKASRPALFKKADRAIELLQKAIPKPPGIEAKVYRTIRGRSYVKDGAVLFGVNALFLGYYCVPDTPSYPAIRGTIQHGGETETWIYIDFNGLNWLMGDRMALGERFKTPKGATIFWVPKERGEIGGMPILLPDVHRERTEAVIISSKSPYRPVTKEQFLQIRAQQADQDLEKARTAAPKYRAELEAQKAKIVAALEALSPEEKKAQAIVKNAYEKEKFFATEAEGGRKIATIAGSLFDAQGSRETIRVITVYWRWDEKKPAKAALIARFKREFDFAALKELLGK